MCNNIGAKIPKVPLTNWLGIPSEQGNVEDFMDLTELNTMSMSELITFENVWHGRDILSEESYEVFSD